MVHIAGGAGEPAGTALLLIERHSATIEPGLSVTTHQQNCAAMGPLGWRRRPCLLRLRLRNQTANSAENTMPLPRSICDTDAVVVSSPTDSRMVAICGDGRGQDIDVLYGAQVL